MSNNTLSFDFDSFLSQFTLFKDTENLLKQYSINNPEDYSNLTLDYYVAKGIYYKYLEFYNFVNEDNSNPIDYSHYVTCLNLAFRSKGRFDSLRWFARACDFEILSFTREYYCKYDDKEGWFEEGQIIETSEGPKTPRECWDRWGDNLEHLIKLNLEVDQIHTLFTSKFNTKFKELFRDFIWDKYYPESGISINSIIIEVEFNIVNYVADYKYQSFIRFAKSANIDVENIEGNQRYDLKRTLYQSFVRFARRV